MNLEGREVDLLGSKIELCIISSLLQAARGFQNKTCPQGKILKSRIFPQHIAVRIKFGSMVSLGAPFTDTLETFLVRPQPRQKDSMIPKCLVDFAN